VHAPQRHKQGRWTKKIKTSTAMTSQNLFTAGNDAKRSPRH
jgi:hypothetical protein